MATGPQMMNGGSGGASRTSMQETATGPNPASTVTAAVQSAPNIPRKTAAEYRNVGEWLTELNPEFYSSYYPLFVEHGWDTMACIELLEEVDLFEMGIPDYEHQAEIAKAVKRLRGA